MKKNTTVTPPSPHRRRARHPRNLKRAAVPFAGLVIGAAALATGGTANAAVHPHHQPAETTGRAGAAPSSVSFVYTGAAQTVQVPVGVTTAEVDIAGAAGGNNYAHGSSQPAAWGGKGVDLTVDVPVLPGDTLTVGVGGQGDRNHFAQSPGNGGWALDGYSGGRGGSAKNGFTGNYLDGAGGGGASVLKVGDKTVIIAAAGGGAAYTSDTDGYGGDGGLNQGENGGGLGGYGGSATRPNLAINGASAAHSDAGGGGGGGGYHNGQGGGVGQMFSVGGGGGGSSLVADGVQVIATGTSGDNGSVKITWLTGPSLAPSGTAWYFQMIGAPDSQLLEVNNNATDNGAVVDTWEKTLDGDAPQANQLWVYQEDGTTGYGQLVNSNSRKCLEVSGASGAVDQWQCIAGASNELWHALTNATGGTALQVKSSGAYLGINPPDGNPGSAGNGTPVTMQTAQTNLTGWDNYAQR